MSKKVFNMAGGRHSAAAYSALENRLFPGGAKASEESLVVSAGSGMQVSIAVGDGLIDTGSDYARRIQITAAETATVAAASGSFGRLDSVVAYIDNAVTPTTGVTDNTNDVLKFAVVSGTAAATPLAPSAAAIQSAIGSGNPYMILANVLVPQSAVNLNSATFTQLAPVINRAGGFKSLLNRTVVYASASSLQVTGFDATSILKRGTIIRLYQGSTVKYFIVESSTFSTNTTVNVSSRGLYTVANSAITGVEYTYDLAIVGIPAAFQDGWRQLSAMTYASASTVTVGPEDYAAVDLNTKIWFNQTTDKYFYVIAKSGGNTLTLASPSGSTVANATIVAPYFSSLGSPPNYPSGDGYVELGRTILTGAGDSISIPLIAARKYLKIMCYVTATGGNVNLNLTFNNDTASNYSYRRSINGGAEDPQTSQGAIQFQDSSSANPMFAEIEVINIAAQEKLLIGHQVSRSTAGAAASPLRNEVVGKWVNTSNQITRIDMGNSLGGDFAIGSELIVLGKN